MADERTQPGSGPDENEPKTIDLGRRDLAGASYGANEREQTEDRRSREARDGDVTNGDASDDLEDEPRS
jgi:hypothetical protein